ncbi:hypothetical protein E6H19_03865 [Candidatus Bathyarchaeota archaeon]|nr:MAG: hypothetical protein AUF79_11190 [Crenarchaeota archaeon 13_1_20CM_2_51_8]TMI23759.1 MAG: hypothetical protein E6H30_07835 [Candidatus Bathyarchaeota archaeon]TMI45676.1 MAG: hypothetical protein E6H19_03865 [Candidatus Bathyarchaeota archaeon]
MDYVQVRPRRPATVTILAVLSIIVAVLSLVLGVAGVVLGAFVVGDYSGLGAIILLVLGTVVFAFGILEIIYSIGFLEGKGWSWTLGTTIAVVSLVSSIGVIGITAIAGPRLAAITSDVYEIVLPELIIISMIAIIPIITSSVTIYVLTRRNVKVFFGKVPEPQA